MSLAAAILAIVVHTKVAPLRDDSLNDFVMVCSSPCREALVGCRVPATPHPQILSLAIPPPPHILTLTPPHPHQTEHWLVFSVVIVLLLRDTHMFGGDNYWIADLVMLLVVLTMVNVISKNSIVGCFKDTASVAKSGMQAAVKGELSSYSAQVGGWWHVQFGGVITTNIVCSNT